MLLLVLLLALTLLPTSSQASYVDYGSGKCASSQFCGSEDPTDYVFEHTSVTYTVPIEMYTPFNLSRCTDWCDDFAGCTGVSFWADTQFSTCLLHGAEGQANFAVPDTDVGVSYKSSFNGTGSYTYTSLFSSEFVCMKRAGTPTSAPSASPFAAPSHRPSMSPVLSSASVYGDPHIRSIYGCIIDAPVAMSVSVLGEGGNYTVPEELEVSEATVMECGEEKIVIYYRKSWGKRISRVDIVRDGGRRKERFEWKTLRNQQFKKVCGNLVQFHRYFKGISLSIEELGNRHFSGLLSDKSCRHAACP